MTGLGRGQRDGDGLEVTHFPDQNHVGILPQGMPQRGGERQGVGADLTLVDHRHLVRVDELDRIFDGHDVHPASAVDLVDHCRQGRRLARPCGSGDQYQPTGHLGQLSHHRGHSQIVQTGSAVGNRPQHRAHRSPLEEDVHPEPALAGEGMGDVEFEVLFELLSLTAGEDRIHELAQRSRLKPVVALDRDQFPIESDLGRCPGGEVQVGASHIEQVLQQLVHVESVGGFAASRLGDLRVAIHPLDRLLQGLPLAQNQCHWAAGDGFEAMLALLVERVVGGDHQPARLDTNHQRRFGYCGGGGEAQQRLGRRCLPGDSVEELDPGPNRQGGQQIAPRHDTRREQVERSGDPGGVGGGACQRQVGGVDGLDVGEALHQVGACSDRAHHTTTLRTSSSVVMPNLAFSMPSWRRVRIPCSTATRLISSDGRRSTAMCWISSETSITSLIARRPR